ncbi:MAG: putative bacterial extracellular solute-binding protein [Clostridia bacterium]|jgi:oligogalacturonide transport system substrate-binding protein|nr:putative bacterial extracellular solute-binding protein [Clostridia bacterium]
MKKMITMLLVIVMMISLAGCGNAGTAKTNQEASAEKTVPETTTSKTEENEPVTLRFSWWGGDARHEATLAVVDLFQKQYPWITIEAEYSAQDGYNDKLMTQLASGTAPDIMQIETGAGPEYFEQGQLYNLSELDIDFSNFDEGFLINNGHFGSDSQYAIPMGKAGSAIIVNQDLAEKIGIDFTTEYDWNQLLEWGKKVQAYDPSLYLISGNLDFMMAFVMRTWGRQMNGQPIIGPDSKLVMTEEQFEKVLTFVKDLYETKTAVPLSYMASYGTSNQDDPNWIAGKYVCNVGYTSSVEVMAAANPNAKYIAGNMPILTDALSDGWVNDCPQYVGIYAKSKHPKEAAMFLDFFFNNDEAIKTLGTVRSVPPTAKAQEITEAAGSLNPLTKMAVDVSQKYNGVSDSGKTTSAEVTAILKDAYETVAYGVKTPAEAAKEAVSLINDYLAVQ